MTKMTVLEIMRSASVIPVIAIDGYEADDVIGTLSCLGEKAGWPRQEQS